MLLLRESHSLVGLHEDEFEDVIRDEWMLDALELRDQWRSALLRTAKWSPLH
jgi:hypothetical protein